MAEPAARLYGVELDPSGVRRLQESGLELRQSQLRQADLLSLDAKQLGGVFGAILGNPPYIRHHLLNDELIARGRASAKHLGIELNGRSDAWAYFCAHLVTFLDTEGRLALVLPGSVLQADYARPLLDKLAADKGEVQLIRIGERMFPNVQERTVLLLIDRGKSSGERVIYRRIANLDGLRRGLLRGSPRAPARSRASQSLDTRLPWRLTRTETSAWEDIDANEGICCLGALAKIRIGVVTGANGFFIRSASDALAMGAAIGSVPIVSRGAWLKAVRWGRAEQVRVAGQPSRLLLFPSSESGLCMAAREELRNAEEQEIHLRSHCARRSPWQSITDTAAPDLFLSYMGADPRWLVINDAQATCSNAIHRVWLHPDTMLSLESIAAGSWTTLYTLSAELVGRSYGGGVLKLEPTGAARLRLPAVESPGLLEEIESVLQARGVDAARMLADRRILMDRLGVTGRQLTALRDAAARLRQLRRR